jgi:hypothetical protein
MSLLDMVKFKRVNGNGEPEGDSLADLEKSAPPAYRALQAVLSAYADTKLSHTLSGVNIISDKLNKGLFEQPQLSTIANVRAQAGIFTIIYVPEYRQFAASSRQVNELRQWINTHQFAGRFKFGRLYQEMTRPLLEVIYEFSYAYSGLKAGQITALAARSLESILGYRQDMLPVVRLFADLRANIDSGGSPVSSDPAGGIAFSQFDNASRVTLSGTTHNHQLLGEALAGFLERRQIPNALMADRKRLRLSLDEPSLRSIDVIAYLTRHNHIVFEGHTPLAVEGAASRFYHGAYMAFLNDNVSLGGSFQVDMERNAVFYRYGVDLRGIEEIADDALLGSLLDEVKRIAPWMEGFRQAAAGADELKVIRRLAALGGDRAGANALEAAERYYAHLGKMFANINAGPRLGLKLPDAASSMLPVTAATAQAAAETQPLTLPADSGFARPPGPPESGADGGAAAESGPPEPQHFVEQGSGWFEPAWDQADEAATVNIDPSARPAVQSFEPQAYEMVSFAAQNRHTAAPQPVAVGFSTGRLVTLALTGLLLAAQIWMGLTLARLNSRVVDLQETTAAYQESITGMQAMVLEALVRVELLEKGQ